MMSLLVVSAIILAVILGYVTRINIGLFAITFAYLIGCFVLQLSPAKVIDMWPLKIFFVIFSVCLFYSFATINGTLEKLAEHLLYRCRNVPRLIPFAIFFIAGLIAAMGAGYYTVLAFMAPLTLLLCQRTGMSLILGAMAVNYGALGGANFMSSQSGVIFRGLMTNAGVSDNDAFVNTLAIFISTALIPLIIISAFVFFTRQTHQLKNFPLHPEKPAPLNRQQKKTLCLIILMMCLVLIVPLLQLLLTDNKIIHMINSKIDIGLIASIFSVIALLLKLGDERKAIASLPWSTLIMICGVGMLISVAIKAGTIDALSLWISGNIPVLLIPLFFGIIAALMSIFASTLGVVTPALFPMVLPLAESLSINPVIIFIAIVVGAQATSISPFSSGGSLLLGSCPDEGVRNKLFPQLLLRAAPLGFIAALLFNASIMFFG